MGQKQSQSATTCSPLHLTQVQLSWSLIGLIISRTSGTLQDSLQESPAAAATHCLSGDRLFENSFQPTGLGVGHPVCITQPWLSSASSAQLDQPVALSATRHSPLVPGAQECFLLKTKLGRPVGSRTKQTQLWGDAKVGRHPTSSSSSSSC